MDSPLNDIRIGHFCQQWAEAQKIKVKYFPQTDSTNAQAKSVAFTDDNLAENLILFFTDLQTAGKGRGTNKWLSPTSGAQLLSTWSFMIESAPHPTVSPQIGLALYKAALSTWPFLDWNLKAPNDLYIKNKKIAGILLETISQGDEHRLLVGLGFNVLNHPSELTEATSLIENLSASTPLLAQDWVSFLERLIFEFSIAIQQSFEPLNTTQCMSLLSALNKHPLLPEKYLKIDEQGNIETENKKISWLEL